jgi:hypothetical protein
VGDRRQPHHVRSEQPLKRQGLGLAQLRELLGNMRDRAVVLADLDGTALASNRGSRVSLLGQHCHQGVDSITDVGDRVEIILEVLGPDAGTVPRELGDPVGADIPADRIRTLARGV